MKIKINEYENHEINFPEEITIQEFRMLVNRIKVMDKAFCNEDVLVKTIKSHTNYIKGKSWTKDRELVLKAVKLCYFGSKEEKMAFAQSQGREWELMVSVLYTIRKIYNITPKEVGVTRFISRGESPASVIKK